MSERKPQDIAGGQEHECDVRCNASNCIERMELRATETLKYAARLAPASVQDQERRCETCAFAERTGQTCPFHPPAPPIAKAGEPPAWAMQRSSDIHDVAENACIAAGHMGVQEHEAPCVGCVITTYAAALAESADRGEEKA